MQPNSGARWGKADRGGSARRNSGQYGCAPGLSWRQSGGPCGRSLGREQIVMQSLVDAAATGSLYALVALAIGLVFGVMRLINFAQADYITIGAYALIVPSASTVPT